MKCFIYVFLFFFSQSFAQNWHPILLNEKHNFEQPLPQILDIVSMHPQMFYGGGCGLIEEHPLKSIIHTIWVDSFYSQNADTFYIFNKKYEESADTWGEFIYKQVSNFLGDTMIKRQNSYYEFIKNDNRYYMYPLAQPLESWYWDSVQNVTATIIHEGDTMLFGYLDSLKVILLSTGDSIVLSKNNGLLYNTTDGNPQKLIGLEIQNKGEVIPKFINIFNFENELTIKKHGEYYTTEGYWGSEKKQIKYYNKQILSPYQIKYTTEETWDRYEYGFWGLNRYVVDGWINNVVFDLNLYGFLNYTDEVDTNKYNRNYRNLIGNIVKYTIQVINNGDTLYPDGDIVTYYDTLTAIPINWYSPFEGYTSDCITGYAIGNDTIGDVWSAEDILGLDVGIEQLKEELLLIYPNPAIDYIIIEWVETLKNETYFTLYNINGQALISKKLFNSVEQIHLLEIPNGVYWIEIYVENKSAYRRLICIAR